MRRFVTVALTAAALAIPSAALVGIAAPAGAVSHVTCSTLKGTTTGTVTVGGCLPTQATNKTVSGASSKLAYGGTLKWAPSGKTTIVSKPKLTTGKACPAGSTEEIATGTVTGGTSAYTKKGDVFSAKVCFKGSTVSYFEGFKSPSLTFTASPTDRQRPAST